jgi:MYXO-CTERM domain-containing protein
VRKLVLTICLLSIAVTSAAAQNGQGQNGQGQNGQGQNGQNGQNPRQHAAEMSSTAMAVAGAIGLGGYLLIRRRVAPQN